MTLTPPPLDEARAYEALYFGNPDTAASEGDSTVAYRIATKIPVGFGGREVHFFSEPVRSLTELGRTVLLMRNAAPKRNGSPWWPSVQRREGASAPWQPMTAFDWEQAYAELTKEV